MDYHPKKSLDIWLNDKGFYRKHVAKDETCFFRAVSDQMYNTQIYHEDLRKKCVEFGRKNKKLFQFLYSDNEWNDYLIRLEKHFIVCGNIEIEIVSKMLERDFIVINSETFEIEQVTYNGYKENISLCKMKDNHYDSICLKEHIDNSGFCQSLVYKLLYEDVYGFEKVEKIVQEMLYPIDDDTEDCEKQFKSLSLNSKYKNDPPFPFKVAKALDPSQYRNIEFDAWNQTRKELRLKDWYMGGEDLKVGTKCLLVEPDNPVECYIQELKYLGKEDDCLVYVVKRAQKEIVKRQNLIPEPNAKAWPLPFSISRNTPNEVSSTENVSSEAAELTENITSNRKRKNKRRNANNSSLCENNDNNNNDVACLEGCPLIASPQNPYFDENFNIPNDSKEEKPNNEIDNFIPIDYNIASSNINFIPCENYDEDCNEDNEDIWDNYEPNNYPTFVSMTYSTPYTEQESYNNFVPQYDSMIQEQNMHTKVTTVCSQIVEKSYSNYLGSVNSAQVAPTYTESQVLNYPEVVVSPFSPHIQMHNPYVQPPVPPPQYPNYMSDMPPGSMLPIPPVPIGVPVYHPPVPIAVPGLPCCVPNCPAILPVLPMVLTHPTQDIHSQGLDYKMNAAEPSYSQVNQNKLTTLPQQGS